MRDPFNTVLRTRQETAPKVSILGLASLAIVIPAFLFVWLYLDGVLGEWLDWGRTAEDRIGYALGTVYGLIGGLLFVVPGLLLGFVSWKSTQQLRWPSRTATAIHAILLAAIFVPLLWAIVSSCAVGTLVRTYHYSVTLENRSQQAVSAAKVKYDDGKWGFTFGNIVAQSCKTYGDNFYPLPQSATVQWMGTDGATHSATVAVASIAPKDFDAAQDELIFRLQPDNAVIAAFCIGTGDNRTLRIPNESSEAEYVRRLSDSLIDAAKRGDTATVRLLVEKGADVNGQSSLGNWTPLAAAVSSGRSEVVAYLLDRGASPQESVLVNAHNKELIGLLVKHGADVNHAEPWQSSPLIAAINQNEVEIVEYLIALGADVNKAVYNGITPIYAAALAGNAQIVALLIRHGANVNVHLEGMEHCTPLSIAREHNHLKVVQLLIQAGAKR